MNEGRFLPARELLTYVQRPGGTRERLAELLKQVRDMAEGLPEDTDGDTTSDVDALGEAFSSGLVGIILDLFLIVGTRPTGEALSDIRQWKSSKKTAPAQYQPGFVSIPERSNGIHHAVTAFICGGKGK